MATHLRRAASGVTLNFAEGCGRTGKAERRRIFTIAQGSAQVAVVSEVLARRHANRPELRLTGNELCDHLSVRLRRFALLLGSPCTAPSRVDPMSLHPVARRRFRNSDDPVETSASLFVAVYFWWFELDLGRELMNRAFD